MPFIKRKPLMILVVLSLVAFGLIAAFIWSGFYNVGADDAHTRPVHAVLETLREQSIAARAKNLQPPNLADPVLIRQGAGNYDSMCKGCHRAPGMPETELSKGLYPAPPALAKADAGDPSKAFWVIKHGIKATGMAAWGKSIEDQYIWGMVAFIQQLPKLDAEGYRVLVASSEGHSHGGGETLERFHKDAAANHDLPHASGSATASQEPNVHRHADGKVHVHQSASPKPVPDEPGSPAKDDGHHHDEN